MGHVDQPQVLTHDTAGPQTAPGRNWDPHRVWDERIRRPRERARESQRLADQNRAMASER